jgi:hypothetical protein
MYLSGDRPITRPEDAQAYSFTRDETGMNMTQFFARTDTSGEYDVSVMPAENGSFAIDALKPRELAPQFTVISIRGRGVTFPAPSDDAIFYAHENSTTSIQIGSKTSTNTWYRMGRRLNSMVCQDMATVCSNITGYCTGWVAPSALLLGTTYAEQLLGSHSSDNNSIRALALVSITLLQSSIYYGVNNRGASALQATRYLQSNMQYVISNMQWKIEAENWFRISLAILQMGTHRMITMPEVDKSRVENGMGVDQAAACSMIKFRSTKHVTLSMFGIITILAVSVLLLLISFLDDILNWLIPKRVSSILQPWERNDYLRLLKDRAVLNSEAVSPAHTLKVDPDSEVRIKQTPTAQAEQVQRTRTSQEGQSPQLL